MKKLSFFLMAMLMSVMSFAAALGEGYEKVTNISTLAAGDRVVVYCDGSSIGVTGWNGSKDATVAADGWVEYLVEAASGGVYLKDEKANNYIASPGNSNQFKYGTKAVCSVDANGVLKCNNRFLCHNNQNGTYYRMYSAIGSYKPFYVYKVVPVEVDPDATIYTVTVKSADETMGTVAGGGEYAEGKTATLEATPNAGYEFVKWSNESTDNPLQITVTGDIELTATFQAQKPITIAEANKLADNATCILNEFVVTYVFKSYIHIQDASGYGMIYRSNFGLKAGDVVTGFTATKASYNGLPQFVPTCALADLTVVAGEAPAVTELTTAPTGNYHQVVKLVNVKMAEGEFTTSANKTLTATCPDETTIAIYNNKNVTATFTADKTYNIIGDVCQYSGKIQVSAYAVEEYVAPVVNHTITVAATAEGEDVVTGGGEYEEGEEVTVTASEDLEGWVFIGWTEDGEFVANDPEYTFVVKGDVELVAVYAMDLGENEVTDLVIDGDNMLLTGSVAGFPMGTMNLELALGEYDEEEGTFLLTEDSKLYVGETNFTFVDGMAAVDMSTNSAMAIVVFQHSNGAYYYMTVNMSAAAAEPIVVVVENATLDDQVESTGFFYMAGECTIDGVTYPVKAEIPGFDKTKAEAEYENVMVEVGTWGGEYLGNATGTATVSVVDNVVTLSGVIENPMTYVAFDVTISGTLPVVEPEVITYELNGGELVVEVPTQEELWASFKTAAGLTTLGTLAEITEAGAGKPHNDPNDPCACRIIFAKLLDANVNAVFALPEWAWLKAYIMTVQSGLPEASNVSWRYAFAAFFLQSQHSAYPASADFTEAGKPEAWGAAYQAAHEVVLPTEPVEEDYTLPTPVKEGYTFVGWYDNAEGKDEPYTVIPAGWSGTLYAIWEAEGPATALDNIAIEGKVVKTIINGQLIIIKNGVQYNAQGQVIK